MSVHLIEPGFHKTNIVATAALERALRHSWEQTSPEVQDDYGEEFLTAGTVITSLIKGYLVLNLTARTAKILQPYQPSSCKPCHKNVTLPKPNFKARYAWQSNTNTMR